MKPQERIKSIIDEVKKLRRVCYPNFNLPISYLTIFAQSEKDFWTLRNKLQKLGDEKKTNNGFKYKLIKPIKYSGETADAIRVRRPDVHRRELGCADLKYNPDDYETLRNIALDKGFDIIVRRDYEMIELSDFKINVFAYLIKEGNS